MTYRPKSYILRGKSYNTELALQWGIDRSLIHVFFILKNRFFKEDESFLVFLPYEPRMFLKRFLINQVQITILMIPMFLCSCNEKKKKKKNMQTPAFLRRFKVTDSVDGVICNIFDIFNVGN